MDANLPIWIVATQWLSRSVLILLLVLSVWSVATMIRSFQILREARGPFAAFEAELIRLEQWISKGQLDDLKTWANGSSSIYSGTLKKILESSLLGVVQTDRAVKSFLSLEKARMEEGLTILATLGSNAPFIGLFGTVLGIIQAFGALGAHQSNSADIMVGISEALFATAVGLFVAIPAVVAFNLASRKLKILIVNSEALKDLYLSKMVGPK